MKKFKVGLQLYSVRQDMEQDMDKTLGEVKAMGYDYVEFAGYFGKSAEEIKALLDKHGLKCRSVHQTHDVFLTAPEENIKFLKTIGVEYCAIPWMPPEKITSKEGFEQLVSEAKIVGKLLKDAGIQLLYHNHDFEFKTIDGETVLDKLYSELGSDIINPELDTCWVHYAGADPVEYINKYADRSQIVHLKDFTCKELGAGPNYALIDENGNEIKPKSREENEFKFQPLGQGRQNMPAILSACDKASTEYIIVEQDQSLDRPALEAVKMSREYLKTLGQ